MSEWLDLMLDEVARKEREAAEAREEKERREKERADKPGAKGEPPAQSK